MTPSMPVSPGGKLVAINSSTGSVTWEAAVARPKGASELERIADVTSLPVMDEQQVCAVAYQGRVACFEITTGNQIWAQDVSSNAGLAMDNHYLYVSENKGAMVAYDKTDGARIWTQSLLDGIRLSPPLVREARIVVGDSLGYVNLIRNDNGAIVARSLTDEGAIVTRPVPLPDGFAVQTMKGGIYAFGKNRWQRHPCCPVSHLRYCDHRKASFSAHCFHSVRRSQWITTNEQE